MALTEDEADFMHAAWQSSQPDGLGAQVEYVTAGCGISIQSASDLADALWHNGLLDNDGSGGAVVFTSKGRGVAIDITAKRKAERKAMAEPTKEQLTRWRDQADPLLAWVGEQTGGSFAVHVDAYKYCNGNNLTKEDIDGILTYFLFSRKHLNGYYVGAMVLGDEIDEAEQTEQSVSLTEEGAKHLAQIKQEAVRSTLPPAPHIRSDLKTSALIRDLKKRLTDQSNSDIPIDEGRFFVAAFDISFERDPKGIYKFNWIKLGASIGFNEDYSRHWIDRLESRGYAKMVEGNEAVLTVSGKEVGRSRAISPTYWSDLEIAVVERAWKIWLGDRYAFNPWAIIGKEPQLPLTTEEMRSMRRKLIRRGVWKSVEVEGAQPEVGTEFTDEVREIYKDYFGTDVMKGLGVPSMRPMKLYNRADEIEEKLTNRIAELEAKHDPSQAAEIERLSNQVAELTKQREGPLRVKIEKDPEPKKPIYKQVWAIIVFALGVLALIAGAVKNWDDITTTIPKWRRQPTTIPASVPVPVPAPATAPVANRILFDGKVWHTEIMTPEEKKYFFTPVPLTELLHVDLPTTSPSKGLSDPKSK